MILLYSFSECLEMVWIKFIRLLKWGHVRFCCVCFYLCLRRCGNYLFQHARRANNIAITTTAVTALLIASRRCGNSLMSPKHWWKFTDVSRTLIESKERWLWLLLVAVESSSSLGYGRGLFTFGGSLFGGSGSLARVTPLFPCGFKFSCCFNFTMLIHKCESTNVNLQMEWWATRPRQTSCLIYLTKHFGKF